jgi:hypothetical protein
MKANRVLWSAAVLFFLLTGGIAQAMDARVVSVSGKAVTIGMGSDAGVQKGNLYLVYADGRERLDYNGSFLGREKHSIAVIRIDKVSKSAGSGEVIGGSLRRVRSGYKVECISARDAKYVSFTKPHAAETWSGEMDLQGWHNPQVYVPARRPQPYPFYQRMHPDDIGYVADRSTDPKEVVDSYPLFVGDKNTRRVAHLNARRLRGRDAYAAYADLAESYDGDYLAAFRAGEEARKLGDYRGAGAWFERSLRINPYYQPALDALRGLR